MSVRSAARSRLIKKTETAISLYKDSQYHLRAVTLICVHLQGDGRDNESKVDILAKILNFCSGVVDHLIYIFGDFNFVSNLEDRQNLRSGVLAGQQRAVSELWTQRFSHFAEIYQPCHTRFPGGQNVGKSAGLDRIYCNAPLEVYRNWKIRCSAYGRLSTSRTSDHLPVVAQIALDSDYGSYSQGVPQHVAESRLFQETVAKIAGEIVWEKCCWARVAQAKDVLGMLTYFAKMFGVTEGLRRPRKGSIGRCVP